MFVIFLGFLGGGGIFFLFVKAKTMVKAKRANRKSEPYPQQGRANSHHLVTLFLRVSFPLSWAGLILLHAQFWILLFKCSF